MKHYDSRSKSKRNSQYIQKRFKNRHRNDTYLWGKENNSWYHARNSYIDLDSDLIYHSDYNTTKIISAWNCNRCTYYNIERNSHCKICQFPLAKNIAVSIQNNHKDDKNAVTFGQYLDPILTEMNDGNNSMDDIDEDLQFAIASSIENTKKTQTKIKKQKNNMSFKSYWKDSYQFNKSLQQKAKKINTQNNNIEQSINKEDKKHTLDIKVTIYLENIDNIHVDKSNHYKWWISDNDENNQIQSIEIDENELNKYKITSQIMFQTSPYKYNDIDIESYGLQYKLSQCKIEISQQDKATSFNAFICKPYNEETKTWRNDQHVPVYINCKGGTSLFDKDNSTLFYIAQNCFETRLPEILKASIYGHYNCYNRYSRYCNYYAINKHHLRPTWKLNKQHTKQYMNNGIYHSSMPLCYNLYYVMMQFIPSIDILRNVLFKYVPGIVNFIQIDGQIEVSRREKKLISSYIPSLQHDSSELLNIKTDVGITNVAMKRAECIMGCKYIENGQKERNNELIYNTKLIQYDYENILYKRIREEQEKENEVSENEVSSSGAGLFGDDSSSSDDSSSDDDVPPPPTIPKKEKKRKDLENDAPIMDNIHIGWHRKGGKGKINQKFLSKRKRKRGLVKR